MYNALDALERRTRIVTTLRQVEVRRDFCALGHRAPTVVPLDIHIWPSHDIGLVQTPSWDAESSITLMFTSWHCRSADAPSCRLREFTADVDLGTSDPNPYYAG